MAPLVSHANTPTAFDWPAIAVGEVSGGAAATYGVVSARRMCCAISRRLRRSLAAGMAHGEARWRCSPASGSLQPREREWSGAKGSRRCGEQVALATEKKEGREGGDSRRSRSRRSSGHGTAAESSPIP